MMDEMNEEWVRIRESLNETLGMIAKEALEANGVRYICKEKIVGVRYKSLNYDIYVLKEDVQDAEACLNKGEFADIPWDPDSDDTNPDPKLPWYLDEKKKKKVGQFILLITFGIVFAALLLRTM